MIRGDVKLKVVCIESKSFYVLINEIQYFMFTSLIIEQLLYKDNISDKRWSVIYHFVLGQFPHNFTTIF